MASDKKEQSQNTEEEYYKDWIVYGVSGVMFGLVLVVMTLT